MEIIKNVGWPLDLLYDADQIWDLSHARSGDSLTCLTSNILYFCSLGYISVIPYIPLSRNKTNRNHQQCAHLLRDSMPWFWQTPPSSNKTTSQTSSSPQKPADDNSSSTSTRKKQTLLQSLHAPSTLLATAILTTLLLTTTTIYRTRLRRIPNVSHLPPSHLHPSITHHPHSLYGRVLTVPDGDGLRLYHTPGGRLALWHLVRKVPTAPFPRTPSGSDSFLKENTLSVRLSGIDAPEGSHFGRPAQAWAEEALDYLRAQCLGKDVRVFAHGKDQYGRVVGSVLVRPWRGWGIGWPKRWWRDVGGELVERGLATVYEGKVGVEFGGGGREGRLRGLEDGARRARKGMWRDQAKGRRDGAGGASRGSGEDEGLLKRTWRLMFPKSRQDAESHPRFETPREFKNRTAASTKTDDGATTKR